MPWPALRTRRIVGLGAGVEGPVEDLHDELRADQREILRLVRRRVGAGVGREPAVEPRHTIPIGQGLKPVKDLVEFAACRLGVDCRPAGGQGAIAEIVGLDEVVAERRQVLVAQRAMPPGVNSDAHHQSGLHQGVRATLRRVREKRSGQSGPSAAPRKRGPARYCIFRRGRGRGRGRRRSSGDAPAERLLVKYRRLGDQLLQRGFRVRLLRRPVRKVLFDPELGQLQPAHLDAGLLQRLRYRNAVLDAGPVIVRADDRPS